mgnify:CR=1 FL=1
MTQEMLIMAAILVAVILLTFIGILSRYRKCKSDEVLVVYGKTGGEKKSAKLYRWGRFRMADHSGLRIPFYETIADRL